MARPTKLTPEVAENIIGNIARGATYKDACEAAGIDYSTLWNWLRRGERARSGKFFEFFDAFRRAEAGLRVNLVGTIIEAANKGDWRAALEYLRRRDKDHWGDNIDISAGSASIVFNVVQRKDEAGAQATDQGNDTGSGDQAGDRGVQDAV